MAAAEKFKAPPEQPPAAGEPPTAAVRPLHDSDEEEVSHCRPLTTHTLSM